MGVVARNVCSRYYNATCCLSFQLQSASMSILSAYISALISELIEIHKNHNL